MATQIRPTIEDCPERGPNGPGEFGTKGFRNLQVSVSAANSLLGTVGQRLATVEIISAERFCRRGGDAQMVGGDARMVVERARIRSWHRPRYVAGDMTY
jgi:hypothetical protein